MSRSRRAARAPARGACLAFALRFNASGLGQKNGTYALTTTWTAAATDATEWTASSASRTFVIGNGK